MLPLKDGRISNGTGVELTLGQSIWLLQCAICRSMGLAMILVAPTLHKQYQAGSQDFVQEGANLARAQGIPYQKLKTPQIWPTIFGGRDSSFFLMFTIQQIFSFSSRGGGAMAPWPSLVTTLSNIYA